MCCGHLFQKFFWDTLHTIYRCWKWCSIFSPPSVWMWLSSTYVSLIWAHFVHLSFWLFFGGKRSLLSLYPFNISILSKQWTKFFFKSVQAKKLVKSKPENLIVSTVQAKKLVNGWISFTVSESWFFFYFFLLNCFFLAWTF